MNHSKKCAICTNKKWCICEELKPISNECEICLCCYSKVKVIAESKRVIPQNVRAEMNETFKFILRVYVEFLLKRPQKQSEN